MKKRYTDEQIIAFLKLAESGTPIKELCRKHGFSDASFYLWRRRFGGMSVPDAKRLRELESENAKLKKLLAEAMLDADALRVVARGKSRWRAPRAVGDHAAQTTFRDGAAVAGSLPTSAITAASRYDAFIGV